MAVSAGPALTLIYNEGYSQVLGPDRHPGALGRPAREVWPEQWEGLLPELQRLMERGESFRQKGGACSFTPIREEDGKVVGTLLVVEETTATLRAQARREEFFAAALANARVGAWDLDLVEHTAHRTVEHDRIFGYDRLLEQWTYEMFLEHVLPEDRQEVDRKYRAAVETGGAWSFECRIARRDGETRWIWAAGRVLSDEAGRRRGMVGIVQDITDRKQNEDALREADRRKNEFLAVLSHELRNPLAPIRNSAQILSRAAPGGEQATRALAVIDRQAEQLAHLVDDLLDVTRIAQDKIHLRRQTLELNDLMQRVIEDQRSLFDQAGVQLAFRPAARPVLVNADPNRLAQVVGNLLQNSAKFTARGGATRVTLHADPGEERAVVEVADNGVGIPPEMVSRLFEPFSQADSSLDRSAGGLGLGLALVKGLVELHGGEVAAHSAGLDRGAEFTVRLPLAKQQAAAPGPGPEPQGPPRRVLVIEDNVDAADTLRDVLAFGGHQVEVAYDGPEGIAKARAFGPEVVLCDIGLPGIDGYEVARLFRADDALKDVFLVALSGYALPQDVQRAQEAGFSRHLPKPPSAQKLEALLAELPR